MIREEFEKKSMREKSRVYVDVSEDTNHGLYIKASLWMNKSDDKCMIKIDL